MSEARRARERAGRRAEVWAAWLLRAKGYRILAVRAKAPVGEVDLIAVGRGRLIAVEVKRRDTLEDAVAALERHRWHRTLRALEWWLSAHPAHAGRDLRFDAVAVAGLRLRHVRDAWRP